MAEPLPKKQLNPVLPQCSVQSMVAGKSVYDLQCPCHSPCTLGLRTCACTIVPGVTFTPIVTERDPSCTNVCPDCDLAIRCAPASQIQCNELVLF